MKGKKFTELWTEMSATEQEELSIALRDKCNISLWTAAAWGKGYRTPKPRSQEIIVRHLKAAKGYETDCKTLFPY